MNAQAPLPADWYDAWKWEMPEEIYKQLNHIQRSQIDKASRLFKQGDQLLEHPTQGKRIRFAGRVVQGDSLCPGASRVLGDLQEEER